MDSQLYPSSSPRGNAGIDGLDEWKANLLGLWYERTARRTEIDNACFCQLFNCQQAPVRALLDHLTELPCPPSALSLATPIPSSSTYDVHSSDSSVILSNNAPKPSSLTREEFSSKAAVERSPLVQSLPLRNPAAIFTLDENLGAFDVPSWIDTRDSARSMPSTQLQDFVSSSTDPDWRPIVNFSAQSDSLQNLLLEYVASDVESRRKRGCGRLDRDNSQNGSMPCTLGCGRSFKRSYERMRHEETVFPQHYWYCYACFDPTDFSYGDLFIRVDKLQLHSTKYHAGLLNIEQCRVSNAPTSSPKTCGLCHYTFRNHDDRIEHINRHHSRTPRRTQSHPSQSARTVTAVTSNCQNYNNISSQSFSATVSEDNVQLSTKPTTRASATAIENISRRYPTSHCHGTGISNLPRTMSSRTTGPIFKVTFHPSTMPSGTASYPLAIQPLDTPSMRGAYGVVYKANIAYDHATMRVSQPFEVAVKQVSSMHCEDWEIESQALSMINRRYPHATIVHCFGTFEHVDDEGHTTYNLLLESGQSNLWQHWMSTAPPVMKSDIAHMWSNYSQLASALECVHNLAREEKYICRHGDLKPENILRFTTSNACGILKIADLGLAKLHQLETDSREIFKAKGGTVDYIAPEMWLGLQVIGAASIVQGTDIWSFGCVLSHAATWLATGFSGIQKFEKLRRSALQRRLGITSASFHDGKRVLPEVSMWHKQLRRCIRVFDTITGPVLDLIDQHLLQGDPLIRTSARGLSDMLINILQRERVESTVETDQNSHIGRCEVDYCGAGDYSCTAFISQLDLEDYETSYDFQDSGIGIESTIMPDLPSGSID